MIKGLEESTNDDLKEFRDDLEKQEKIVNKKIGPILDLYNQGKIKKRELIEKLSEAFYSLETNDSIE